MRKSGMVIALTAVAVMAVLTGCNLFVKAPTLEALTASKTTLWLFSNQAPATVTLTGTWSDNSQSVVTDATWSSDNTSVATVSNGVITPHAVGTATITATKDSKTATVAVTVVAPGPFADAELRYYKDGDTPTTEKVLMAGWEGSGSFAIADDGVLTATFLGYPQWWGGGIAFAQKPTVAGVTGNFDFSQVASVSFDIKSANIPASKLGYFIQWLSPTDGNGGEHVVWLNDANITDISDWTTVTINLSSVANDGRYGKGAEDYANAKAYVDTAFAIRWGGYTGQFTGDLTANDSYQIRNIAFKDASGNPVKFWTNIAY